MNREENPQSFADGPYSSGQAQGSSTSVTGSSGSIAGYINGNEEESSSPSIEIRGLELEARIARLERIVAELRADISLGASSGTSLGSASGLSSCGAPAYMHREEKPKSFADGCYSSGQAQGPSTSVTGSSVCIAGNINENEEEISSPIIEIPGLELDARIANLERQVAELKSTVSGHRKR